MVEPKLSLLESRLERIEKLIYGQAEKDADYPKDSSQIIDAVHAISSQVSAATAGRSRIEAVFKRLDELEQYIDPRNVEQLSLSASAKTDLLLADEASICRNVGLLEKLETMKDVLDSEHIRSVPMHQNKLYELCKIHLQQQDEASQLTEDTKKLIDQYNSIIMLLSNQFVQWDELVTQLEISAQQPVNVD